MLTFPANQLEELKQWLKDQFIEYRPPAGSYQLIKIATLKDGFRSIYQSPHGRDTFWVDPKLESTIKAFLARKKK